MSSNAGHNPAAYDPAVIYWDWEGKNATARPPPGLEHSSKPSKYPPGLGPTEPSPWDKPYFQRPGSRSRAGTLRRADVLIGDPKVQPDVNLEKFTISAEPMPSKKMPDFPETLYSESKRKVFEEMGNGFIESLQKLDKSGAGTITDFSPILEEHWNQLAEFYSTIVSAARMLRSGTANSTHWPIFNDSPPTLQPSPNLKSLPQEERTTKEAFKSCSTLVEGSKKEMHSTSPKSGQGTTYGPINKNAGGLEQEDSRTLGLADDTNLDFSTTEQKLDVKVSKITPIASTTSTFERKLSEAIKSVGINLKPFDATWDESQAEGHGHPEVVTRTSKTKGTTLHADTQMELEMQEMIQQENHAIFTKTDKFEESGAVAMKTTQNEDAGYLEKNRQNFQTPFVEGIEKSDFYKSNHSSRAGSSLDTNIKKSTECMHAADTCTGSANDITIKKTSEKHYSVVKDDAVKESYLSGETDKPELSHAHKNISNPITNESTSFYCDYYSDISSAAGSVFNIDCGSTPEEIVSGEVSHLVAITADPTSISVVDKDEKTPGLLQADNNDSFSLSSSSSLFLGSTKDELEKLQVEVINQLEKAKADGGPFTAKWMDQFGIKIEKRSEIGIKPDSKAEDDQAEDKHSASVYYDVEVTSSDDEDEITNDMEEILTPMIESITHGSETDESAKEYIYDLEGQTSTRTNDKETDIKANGDESGGGKNTGEGGDGLKPLEQTVAEHERELGTGREESDDQAGDLADGRNVELASDKSQTGGKPDETVTRIEDTENDEDGDKMGRMNSEELAPAKL
ncbi:hypothetical protein DFP73DRAFT_610503 [Morchella snyderi]|nr:hypothetical protein DFP73DRAFT_610503 [Morchella snyderi]